MKAFLRVDREIKASFF